MRTFLNRHREIRINPLCFIDDLRISVNRIFVSEMNFMRIYVKELHINCQEFFEIAFLGIGKFTDNRENRFTDWRKEGRIILLLSLCQTHH